MLGAICGDIIGSVYEFNSIKTTEFPLFSEASQFTDDTVMTIAVADALMATGGSGAFEEALKASMLRFGKLFPHAGYGGRFARWLTSNNPQPYSSWGNGSAMRVSPVGWFCGSLEQTERLAEMSARVTHNHPEGIKGAQATAAAIYMAREGAGKPEIKDYISSKYGYDLQRSLEDIRPGYAFEVSCQRSVPESIICFLEAGSYEETVRNAVSLGGDADTMAAIAGGIAEGFYGVPRNIAREAKQLLAPELLEVLNRWEEAVPA